MGIRGGRRSGTLPCLMQGTDIAATVACPEAEVQYHTQEELWPGPKKGKHTYVDQVAGQPVGRGPGGQV